MNGTGRLGRIKCWTAWWRVNKVIIYLFQHPSVEEFRQVSNQIPSPWNDDSYMKPELDDDPLLQFGKLNA